MKIRQLPIAYYVGRLASQDYFAFAGYSDAEWYCILHHRVGEATGLGQIIDTAAGVRLLEVLKRRHADPNFLFAVPSCLWEMEDCIAESIGPRIERILDLESIQCDFYGRDVVLDELAKYAGLYPLIHQLLQMPVVIIGNEHLRRIDFLDYDHFVEVSMPNLHLERDGIEQAAAEAIHFGQPAAYLISAGISAALIIDLIYDEIPNSFFIDCGSIWDGFVGIGAQRSWRAELYADPELWSRWKYANLTGEFPNGDIFPRPS